MRERFLEPLFRRMRISRVTPYVRKYPDCELLDIGCGRSASLLKQFEPYIKSGVGIDRHVTSNTSGKLTTFSSNIENDIPLAENSFDLITMLAVMEHIENDEALLRECVRLLRPNGGLLVTVPSWKAKPVLEFLSKKLRLVSSSEIDDHKRYYSRRQLNELFNKNPEFCNYKHEYFQFQFNNLIFCQVKK